MKKILLLSGFILLTFNSFAGGNERTDKKQTFQFGTPYEVETIKSPKGKKVKNVILMIGDGMSLMHVYSAWTANGGKLWLQNASAVGLSITTCNDRLITDSGAGGTAMATGHKTNYHYVGVDPDGKPLKSIMDYAKEKGKSTGMAVTCRIWDATPASFCCHNSNRDNEEDIVTDYVGCNIDYAFGGGWKLFKNRKDGRDLLQELRDKNYLTPSSWDELEKVKKGRVFALVDSVDTPLPAERGDLLARASIKGINLLNQNKKGFFMMIEGSQLDDYGHFNDLNLLMQETLDFDQTVGRVLKWAEKDGETLVIVTADHETGGLTMVGGDQKENTVECKFSTTSHSGAMVPVYAYGPKAEEFTGIYHNTEIFHKIKRILGL